MVAARELEDGELEEGELTEEEPEQVRLASLLPTLKKTSLVPIHLRCPN